MEVRMASSSWLSRRDRTVGCGRVEGRPGSVWLAGAFGVHQPGWRRSPSETEAALATDAEDVARYLGINVTGFTVEPE
jgi:hypothetical protein